MFLEAIAPSLYDDVTVRNDKRGILIMMFVQVWNVIFIILDTSITEINDDHN